MAIFQLLSEALRGWAGNLALETFHNTEKRAETAAKNSHQFRWIFLAESLKFRPLLVSKLYIAPLVIRNFYRSGGIAHFLLLSGPICPPGRELPSSVCAKSQRATKFIFFLLLYFSSQNNNTQNTRRLSSNLWKKNSGEMYGCWHCAVNTTHSVTLLVKAVPYFPVSGLKRLD